MTLSRETLDNAQITGGENGGPLLAARNVSVNFGGIQALAHVSMDLAPRSLTGLVGPNGAGKSTLLAVLSGMQKARAGSVFLGGKDVTSWPAHCRARAGLARTFQLPELFAGLTVRQHLSLPYRLRHERSRLLSDLWSARGWLEPSAPEQRRMSQLLEWLDLTQIQDAPVAGLPLGYCRLVEVGRALAASPQAVLLDEPLSGLDQTESARLADILSRVVETEDVSFLLVDHDVELVLQRSAFVYVLDFGRLIAQGTPSAVRDNRAVRNAYLGEPLRIEDTGDGHS